MKVKAKLIKNKSKHYIKPILKTDSIKVLLKNGSWINGVNEFDLLAKCINDSFTGKQDCEYS